MDYKEYEGMVNAIERQKRLLEKVEQQPNVILIDKSGVWNYDRFGIDIKIGKEVEPDISKKIEDVFCYLENAHKENDRLKKRILDLETKENKKSWWNIF